MKEQRSYNTQTEHIDEAGCLLGTCFCHFEATECLWLQSVDNTFKERCEIRTSLNLDGVRAQESSDAYCVGLVVVSGRGGAGLWQCYQRSN